MKTAPPIAFAVPPSRGWAIFEGALAGIATTALLAWDGARWTLDDQAAQRAVQIDAGALLLLRARVQGTGRTHWLPVTAGAVGPAWHPMRAALYSRPPEATPGDAPPARGPPHATE